MSSSLDTASARRNANAEQRSPAPGPVIWLCALIVLLAALLPFAEVRHFDHVWDDHVLRGPGSAALSPDVSWPQLLAADLFAQPGAASEASGLWRPLVLASYRVEAKLAGASQAGFLWLGHVGTWLLHGLASLALFGLLQRLGLSLGAALLGAVLFGLHPVHAEPVSWLSGRMDIGATAFGLLALGLQVHRRSPAPEFEPQLRTNALVTLGAATLLLSALLCKETAVVFLALSALLLRSTGRTWRQSLVAPALSGLAYAGLRVSVYEGRWLPASGFAEASEWWTALGTIPAQLRLMLWPGAPTPLHAMGAHESFDGVAAAGIVALLLLIGLSLRAVRHRQALGVLAFGILAIGLGALLPWARATARSDLAGPLNERYLYALSLAPCVALAWLASRSRLQQPRFALAASLGMLLVLTPITASRSDVWRNDASFVEAGLRRLPTHPDLWVLRGDAALQAYAANQDPKHLQHALVSLETALRHKPEHRVAAVNRFIVLASLGREEQVSFLAETLLKRWPDDSLVLFNLAVWHAEAGRVLDARRLLTRDLNSTPWHPRSRALLAELR